MLGTYLCELLTDITHQIYTTEAEYQLAIQEEYDRLYAIHEPAMTNEDFEIFESTRAVLFWSYSNPPSSKIRSETLPAE